MNFLLDEMTFLRYYAPIVIESSKRGNTCKFFIRPSRKYNCPSIEKNKNQLLKFCNENNVEIYDAEEVDSHPGLTFLIEGVMRDLLNFKHHSVSLTYMTDFRISYKSYVNDVDNIIFPSEKFANFYGTVSNKNLYLGSPKYDINIEKKAVCEHYNLKEDENYCLIVYPKERDQSKINVDKIIRALRKKGLVPIIKSRGKDRVFRNHDCKIFKDEKWHPHTTLELLNVCDLVVNTGSTTIKEAIISEVPVINFDIKSHHKHLGFLYEYNFCIDQKEYSEKDLEYAIEKLLGKDFREDFNLCKVNDLFLGNSTKRILEYFDD